MKYMECAKYGVVVEVSFLLLRVSSAYGVWYTIIIVNSLHTKHILNFT